MQCRSFGLVLLLLTSVPIFCRAERPSAAVLQEYFLPPELSGAALSPTGEYLGCIVRRGDVYGIGVYTFATKQFNVLGGSQDRQVLAFWWKGPRRLLLDVSNQKRDGRSLMAIDIDGKNSADLWRAQEVRGRILDGLPEDPKHLLKQNASELLLVDIDNGDTEELDSDPGGGVFHLLADNTRRFRAAYLHDSEGNQTVKWKPPGANGSDWHRIAFKPDERGFRPFGFDEDPRYLWVWDYSQGNETVAAKFDTLSGERVVVGRKPGFDATHALLFGRFNEPLALIYSQDTPMTVLPLSAKYADSVRNLQERFTGFFPRVVDTLPDKRTWIVWAGNSRLPGAYFLFDSQKNQSSLIGLAFSSLLTEDKLAPAEQFALTSRGGRRLRGLLWSPPGLKRPPLLVFCPETMPGNPVLDVYDPEIQALVAHGFAVAKIDARGTYGYGESNLAEADGYISVTLREDFEDFVRAATANGYVDGSRIGLFGEGLSGALALKVAAASDLFSVAVTINAPAHLTRASLENYSREFSSSRTIARLGGWSRSAKLAAELSPIEVGPALKKPALYLYNTETYSATRLIEMGRDMKHALEKTGVPAQVGIAYGPGEAPRPPSAVARDRANQIVQIADFLEKTWQIR